MRPPPRCSADAGVETALNAKTEVGFTLQTLIVMAVFVLAAVGAGIGLIAVTTSSSDDFEDAGKTGVEERCAPNEVKDPELEARGVAGVNQRYREVVSDTIGCNPVCGTWEYYEPGLAAAGTGGPEGNGGIYSTDEGCFAPCYWSFGYPNGNNRPTASHVRGNVGFSGLLYFDDNRAPVVDQFRLGVNYRRSADPDVDLPTLSDPPTNREQNNFAQTNDLDFPSRGGNTDGKHFFLSRHHLPNGVRNVAGTLPLHPDQIAAGFPTVFKPNWVRSDDDNWEVRADPSEGLCTIVDTTNDQIICSSDWDDCATPS